MGAANLAFKKVDDYWVVAHTTEAPTDIEWHELLATLRRVKEARRARVFIYTDGGAPNARQRALLNQALDGARPPIAVVTASAVARAASTAISWFTPTIRIFAPHESERALDHLDASALDRARIKETLAELKAKIGSSPASPA